MAVVVVEESFDIQLLAILLTHLPTRLSAAVAEVQLLRMHRMKTSVDRVPGITSMLSRGKKSTADHLNFICRS